MLEAYVQEFTDFSTALAREYYLHYSGRKGQLDLAPIYDRYGDLYTRDAIADLRRELEDTSEHFETQRAALERLLLFATNHYLENAARQLTEEVARYEAGAAVRAAGREMTFQAAAVAARAEADRPTRRALYQGRLEVIAASNDLRGERLTRMHEAARGLGYESYAALYESLRHLDYARLSAAAAAFLSHTEGVYAARLDDLLRRDLGLRPGEAGRHDLLHLLHLGGYEEWFPAGRLLRAYRNTLDGLNINTHTQKNIEIDVEDRPRKRPRAFVATVVIPDEIKLVIRPAGGPADYAALLHEAGHAQHYGRTAPALRPEFKYAGGDRALTETYAYLFNSLLLEGAWLAETCGFTQNQEFVRSAMFARLATVRQTAAKVIYERELHGGGDYGGAAARYGELLTDATKVAVESAEYLSDVDDAFYAADRLRARAFEVMLRDYLKTRFGQRWWQARRAGGFLKELWETGDRYTADEMARQVGLGEISFGPLTEEFNQARK